MTPDRLLAQYDRIADAPDAIARLRRFVLDLAVRGKLVAQSPREGSATSLLNDLAAHKARLARAGQIKADKPLSPVADGAAFAIPKNWQWTRLGTIALYIQRGKSPKYALSDGTPVVSQKCVQWSGLDLSVARQITMASLADYEAARFLQDGDLLWNSTGTGTIGRIIRLDQPPAKLVCDSHVTVVRCQGVDPEYIRTWLRSDHVYGQVEARASGSTNQVELTAQMAINQAVPLPPLAEQHRIVAKVEELMALCDRLEAGRAAREAARDRLAAASLARLNTPDPDPATFTPHARFALNTLPALTTRPDQIKALRQTILNLAVRGKLVPRIAGEKLDRRIQPAGSDGEPELPAHWGRVPLEELLAEDTRNGYARRPDEASDGVPILRISAGTIRVDGMVAEEEHKLISGITSEVRLQYGLLPGDLLACRFNGNKAFVGRLSLFGDYLKLQPIYPDKLIRIRLASNLALPTFIRMSGDSDLIRRPVEECCATTVGNWGISASNLKTIAFPVPPLEEQHRIVAKVDALIALCGRLEAALATGADISRRLLDALLQDALAPRGDQDTAA